MNPLSSRWKKVGPARSKRRSALRLGRSLHSLESLEDRLALAVSYATVNDWGSGLQGEIAISNDQSATIKDWRLEFDYGRTIGDIWNAQIVSRVGNRYVIQSASWNNTLAVGQAISFGFTAGSGADAPRNFLLSGGGATPQTPPGITIGDVSVTEGNPTTASISG